MVARPCTWPYPDDLRCRGQELDEDHVWRMIAMSENWSTHVTCELTTGWLASCHSLTRAEHWRDVYQYHPHVPSSSVRGSESGSLAAALLNITKKFSNFCLKYFWLLKCMHEKIKIVGTAKAKVAMPGPVSLLD